MSHAPPPLNLASAQGDARAYMDHQQQQHHHQQQQQQHQQQQQSRHPQSLQPLKLQPQQQGGHHYHQHQHQYVPPPLHSPALSMHGSQLGSLSVPGSPVIASGYGHLQHGGGSGYAQSAAAHNLGPTPTNASPSPSLSSLSLHSSSTAPYTPHPSYPPPSEYYGGGGGGGGYAGYFDAPSADAVASSPYPYSPHAGSFPRGLAPNGNGQQQRQHPSANGSGTAPGTPLLQHHQVYSPHTGSSPRALQSAPTSSLYSYGGAYGSSTAVGGMVGATPGSSLDDLSSYNSSVPPSPMHPPPSMLHSSAPSPQPMPVQTSPGASGVVSPHAAAAALMSVRDQQLAVMQAQSAAASPELASRNLAGGGVAASPELASRNLAGGGVASPHEPQSRQTSPLAAPPSAPAPAATSAGGAKNNGMFSPPPPPPATLHQQQQQQQQRTTLSSVAPHIVDDALAKDGRRYRLEHFDLLETLGTGTFGRVHLARLHGSNQFFAMKVLKKTEVVRLKQVEHINAEKAILSRIYHPFIVNLFCTFQDPTNLYMLLEYVCGGELFSHLRRAGKFANDVARFYAAEIVSAIDYLHKRDIIYRDLKPENLLLDARGHIKIADFGFAKIVEDRTWTLCGTPEYLAPEIIQGRGHGRAVDWWALGILIFEMLCGYPPFFDDSPYGIYEKILLGRIHFPSFVDPAAKDLIKRLLTADTTRRIGNLRNGADDVKHHPWFKGVDWNAILSKRIAAPIVPRMSGPGDTTNFEKYPEPEPEANPDLSDPYGCMFPSF
ncbi:cytochrome c oxidase subunit 1 [Blastocladiella emersonii ATCC 22665]|nr:cytochrome c oxidase subunit 1 [Blastocladiella emersonii ATCC 22665]